MIRRTHRRFGFACRHGLSLTMVFAAIGLGAIMVAVLLPSIGRARETANRVKCANNLKQLGLGIMLYANENRGNYPRTTYKPDDTLIPDVTNAGFDSPRAFNHLESKVPDNCMTSSLFLLLRNEDLASAVFICPSTTATPDEFGGANNLRQRSNFTDLKKNLSYSHANPFPDNPAAAAGYKLTTRLDPGFAVLADQNPGMAGGANVLAVNVNSSYFDMRQANTRNHRTDGQNILYADGHVEFNSNPLAGLNHDNIYCRGAGGPGASKDDIVNSPKDKSDSVLLPAATD